MSANSESEVVLYDNNYIFTEGGSFEISYYVEFAQTMEVFDFPDN
jgi:hypothetical protein